MAVFSLYQDYNRLIIPSLEPGLTIVLENVTNKSSCYKRLSVFKRSMCFRSRFAGVKHPLRSCTKYSCQIKRISINNHFKNYQPSQQVTSFSAIYKKTLDVNTSSAMSLSLPNNIILPL